LKVGYLVGGYPRTSHSFIRREIKALESLGVEVLRHSQRPLDEPLVTEADQLEYARTRVILSEGVAGHAWAVAAAALRRPLTFVRALSVALTLGNRSERGPFRHLVYLAEAAVLERWLRASGVSHLHAHFGGHTATVALLCRCLGGPPFSFTIHGLDEYDGVREKVAQAAFVVAISSFGRAQLYRRTNTGDWSKIHEVHCGVDERLLSAPLTPVPQAPRLVCVARFHVEKGHLVLLEAAARLAADGMRFEIVLVGDGPLRPVIEERVRRLGLEQRIDVAGWMSEERVREAILASRALVLPSFAEGLPVVLMEALALGRPVIASTLSGIPELVVPGTNGWLVPAGSVEALVPALREALVARPERLEAMGRAGAALVAQRHDTNREARKLLALLRASVGELDPHQPAAPAAEVDVAAELPRTAAHPAPAEAPRVGRGY
jgi:glycosyltransferase involved in cell wall biosynthesis